MIYALINNSKMKVVKIEKCKTLDSAKRLVSGEKRYVELYHTRPRTRLPTEFNLARDASSLGITLQECQAMAIRMRANKIIY